MVNGCVKEPQADIQAAYVSQPLQVGADGAGPLEELQLGPIGCFMSMQRVGRTWLCLLRSTMQVRSSPLSHLYSLTQVAAHSPRRTASRALGRLASGASLSASSSAAAS